MKSRDHVQDGASIDQLNGRSRFLDPHLTLRPGTPLHKLANEIEERLRRHRAKGLTRKPRNDAAERMRAVNENIIANLACLVLSADYQPGDTLAISTAKTRPTRYDHSALGRHLWGLVSDELAAAGDILKHSYVFKQRLTTVEPRDDLLARLQGGSLADLSSQTSSETIWLSARTAIEGWHGQPPPKELMDYRDDADSRRFRREIVKINRFLNRAELTFDGRSQGPIALRRTFLLRRPTDSVAFNLNGRLAGGWWLQLPARDRHRIRLLGEPLADLDFKGMFVQLAYRSLDWQLREDFDPYGIPGLEHHRDGAKLAMLSLLGRSKRMRALSPELRQALPDGWNVARLTAAVDELHHDIASLFGKDRAVELMFQESEILIAVLLRLIDVGIPALPMHDGIMVPRSMKAVALGVMREVSSSWLGGPPLPITEKPIPGAG